MINQYIHNGSDVYSCLLGASKSSDHLHYFNLFVISLSNKLPIISIIRLILDSYSRQYVRVIWDSCT